MKQVWVNLATCSRTRATTRGSELPTLVTAIPEAKSISWLPSTSRRTPPEASSTYTGSTVPTARLTARRRRSCNDCEPAPGSAVPTWEI